MGEITRHVTSLTGVLPAVDWVKENINRGVLAGPVLIVLKRPLRNSEQNAKLWAMLSDIEKQATWYNRKLNKTQWKDLLTAAWRQGDSVPGIDGGVVVFGVSTSTLGKKDFADLIESIYAWGAETGIIWSEGNESNN